MNIHDAINLLISSIKQDFTKEEINEVYTMGVKRAFRIDQYTLHTNRSNILPMIKSKYLTQWQNVTYRHSIVKANDEYAYLNNFYDLHMLVTSDGKACDNFHRSAAIIQIVDTAEKNIEHRTYDVTEQGYADEPESLIDFIRDSIDQSMYVAIELDEFYLTEKSNHNRRHETMRNLIFGYDDGCLQFYSIGFIDQARYGIINISYDDLIYGYEFNKLINRVAPWYMETYKFTNKYTNDQDCRYLQNFFLKINNYLHSSEKYDLMERTLQDPSWNTCRSYYGLSIYENLNNLLEQVVQGEASLCYQCLHAIYEQKLMLYERLQYISEYYKCIAHDDVSTFLEIAKSMHNTCLLCIKNNIKEKGIFTKEISSSTARRLIPFYKESCEKEEHVLCKIINAMLRYEEFVDCLE